MINFTKTFFSIFTNLPFFLEFSWRCRTTPFQRRGSPRNCSRRHIFVPILRSNSRRPNCYELQAPFSEHWTWASIYRRNAPGGCESHWKSWRSYEPRWKFLRHRNILQGCAQFAVRSQTRKSLQAKRLREVAKVFVPSFARSALVCFQIFGNFPWEWVECLWTYRRIKENGKLKKILFYWKKKIEFLMVLKLK